MSDKSIADESVSVRFVCRFDEFVSDGFGREEFLLGGFLLDSCQLNFVNHEYLMNLCRTDSGRMDSYKTDSNLISSCRTSL